MRLPIYSRFELRTNNGNVLRAIERFSVIDTSQDINELSELIQLWAAEAGEKFAICVSLQNADKKALRRDIVRATIAASEKAEAG